MASSAQFDPHTSQATRRRLMEAAGEVFAEQGYHHATVRDICARAQANVASISYHFGDKEKLYEATFDYWIGLAMERYPPTLGIVDSDPPQKQLRAFIWSFVHRALDTGRPAIHGKLILREMIEPTCALDRQVELVMKPASRTLWRIVASLLGANANDATIRRSCCSIVGQIVFHHHGRALIERIYPEQHYDPVELEHLVDHITTMSLGGLSALAGNRQPLAHTPDHERRS
jgi:AcrR family transcriptional regulator